MDPRLYVTLSSTLNLLLLVLGGLGLVAAIYGWPGVFGASGRLGWLVARLGAAPARIVIGVLCAGMLILALVRMTGMVAVPGA